MIPDRSSITITFSAIVIVFAIIWLASFFSPVPSPRSQLEHFALFIQVGFRLGRVPEAYGLIFFLFIVIVRPVYPGWRNILGALGNNLLFDRVIDPGSELWLL